MNTLNAQKAGIRGLFLLFIFILIMVLLCAGNALAYQILVKENPNSLDERNSGQISVYPNPIQDRLFIHSETVLIDKVEILNLLGQPVKVILAGNKESLEIERGTLPSGTYLLKVKDIKGSESFYRLVLQ